jgi:hypothetical protein
MSKEAVLGKLKFDPFFFIFSPQSYFYYNNILIYFLSWTLAFFLPKHIFCLSHHKNQWTMSVDNVSLKKMSFGDLKLHDHFDIFFLGVKKPYGVA